MSHGAGRGGGGGRRPSAGFDSPAPRRRGPAPAEGGRAAARPTCRPGEASPCPGSAAPGDRGRGAAPSLGSERRERAGEDRLRAQDHGCGEGARPVWGTGFWGLCPRGRRLCSLCCDRAAAERRGGFLVWRFGAGLPGTRGGRFRGRGVPAGARPGGVLTGARVFSPVSCRAVAQPLVPVLGQHSAQARSLQPQWRKLFHVRDRELLQSFMSSLLLQTEDTKKLQSKSSSSY